MNSPSNLSQKRDLKFENALQSRLSEQRFFRLREIRPICLFETDSTQDDLSLRLKSQHEGDVVVSRIQVKGRGRENRIWISDEGGLWFSITLRPSKADHLQGLAMLAAMSVCETLNTFSFLHECIVKYPNDVYFHGKKIAGVLVDGQIKGQDAIAYLGIGINLNNNPRRNNEIQQVATSYYAETGKKTNLEDFLVTLLQNLDKSYDELEKQVG